MPGGIAVRASTVQNEMQRPMRHIPPGSSAPVGQAVMQAWQSPQP